LMRVLQDAVDSKDLNVDITQNSALYSVIRGYWKDTARDELVRQMLQRLPLTQQISGRINANIDTILASLPPDWEEESSILASMLRDKLSISRHSL